MIRNIPPWTQLTRLMMPEFAVIRRPLTWASETVPVGAPLPVTLASNRMRLRQFYEQRRIGPVEKPVAQPQTAKKRR